MGKKDLWAQLTKIGWRRDELQKLIRAELEKLQTEI